jgi:hypothetical protein
MDKTSIRCLNLSPKWISDLLLQLEGGQNDFRLFDYGKEQMIHVTHS